MWKLPAPRSRHRRTGIAALACSALVAGCGGGTTGAGDASPSAQEGGKLKVVAALYPLQYLAEEVGGSAVSVTSLAAPGVEPHDLEMTAQQIAEIASADLVLYIPGFMPAVDDAVAQQASDHALDVSAGLSMLEGHDHAGEATDQAHSESDGDAHAEDGADAHPEGDHIADPHVWLSPNNMKAMAEAVAKRLSDAATADTATFKQNAQAVGVAMDKLAAEMSAGTKNCAIKPMVVAHEAFGYLAKDLGFTQIGISGLSPEAEPSPARIKQITDVVTAEKVSTIYYETLISPKVAQTIAAETGAKTAVLDPIEGNTDGKGYEALMRENLSTLRAGQSCA